MQCLGICLVSNFSDLGGTEMCVKYFGEWRSFLRKAKYRNLNHKAGYLLFFIKEFGFVFKGKYFSLTPRLRKK